MRVSKQCQNNIYSPKTITTNINNYCNIANHKVFLKLPFLFQWGFQPFVFWENPGKWPVSSPPKVNRLRSPESTVDVWRCVAFNDITCQWSNMISMKIQVMTIMIMIINIYHDISWSSSHFKIATYHLWIAIILDSAICHRNGFNL